MDTEILIIRNENKDVLAFDPVCPHMGSDLSLGRVRGTGVECARHAWQFDETGKLCRVPCRSGKLPEVQLESYPIKEAYGLIWVYPQKEVESWPPTLPRIEGHDVSWKKGKSFVTFEHPHSFLSRPIDVQHFKNVRNFSMDFKFDIERLDSESIKFQNKTTIPKTSCILKVVSRLYLKYFTFNIQVFSSSACLVEWGPDLLRCYLFMALTPLNEKQTKVQVMHLVPDEKSSFGRFRNFLRVLFSKPVAKRARYLRPRDQESRTAFTLNHALREDEALIEFQKYLEALPRIK